MEASFYYIKKERDFEMIEKKVTSLQEMKDNATPIVSIPAWNGDGEVFVRLKRVSLLSLVQSGQLPNELLGIAHKVANQRSAKDDKGEPVGGTPFTQDDPENFKKFSELMHVMAKVSLVEPTYEEVMEEVGFLTDQQLMSIFFYGMVGVEALKSFRTESRIIAKDGDSSENI